MNQVVKEMSDKAITLVPAGLTPEAWIEVYNEKLIELVVHKCCVIANYAYDGGEYPSGMIKQYFGVE